MTEREQLVRACYAAWNDDDLEAYLATLHPDVRIRPVFGRNLEVDVYRGHAGALRWHADAKGEFERLASHPLEIVERDGFVMTRVRVEAHGRASGASVVGEVFHVGSFRDGLIVSIEGFTQEAEARQALEAIAPARASPRPRAQP